ncbi:MAG TPA: PAS domain S-box protein [Burkholderiales bacterium]|nr:PAS domain S-box protein [Burkholderiales bacterium]
MARLLNNSESWWHRALTAARSASVRPLHLPPMSWGRSGRSSALERVAARRQAVARLARCALSERDSTALFEAAAHAAALGLDAEYASVLEIEAPQGLLPRAAVGWPRGPAGQPGLDGAAHAHAVHASGQSGPVLVADFRSERRFRFSPMPADAAVLSGVCAPILRKGSAVGVVGVHAAKPRAFTPEDAAHVQELANVLADAIARSHAEHELRSDRARFRGLFDYAPDLCLLVDCRTGRIARCNLEAQSLLGFTTEEVLDRPVSELCLDGDGGTERRVLAALLRGDSVRDAELRARRRDGSSIEVSVSASPIRDPDGQVSWSLCVWRDISPRKQAERMLVAQQTHLRALAYELSVAEERERRRVAAGLHDDIGQVLALAKLKTEWLLEGAQAPGQRVLLEEVRGLLRQAASATRSATFELSSPVLHQLGLEAALQSLGERMEHRYGLRFEFDPDEVPACVPEETGVVLFRAVRELLHNVHKHARASCARIALRIVPEGLLVRVEDDGVGFEAGAPAQGFNAAGGFGLFSITAQIGGIGGRVEVQSSPGAGTRVSMTVPMAQRPAA